MFFLERPRLPNPWIAPRYDAPGTAPRKSALLGGVFTCDRGETRNYGRVPCSLLDAHSLSDGDDTSWRARPDGGRLSSSVDCPSG